MFKLLMNSLEIAFERGDRQAHEVITTYEDLEIMWKKAELWDNTIIQQLNPTYEELFNKLEAIRNIVEDNIKHEDTNHLKTYNKILEVLNE